MSAKKLVQLLKEADIAYYDKGTPIMEDDEYDALVSKLKKLDPSSPYLKKVGYKISRDKVKLPLKMGSLDKIRPSSVQDFIEKYKKETNFIVTPKLDGFSCLLEYVDGKFKRAFTRGDGYYGRDITSYMKYVICKTDISKNPLGPVERFFTYDGKTFIIGELIMNKSVFNKKFKGKYANARNFVVGLFSRKLDQETIKGLKNTCFVAYGFSNEHKPKDKAEQLSTLDFLKFITVYNAAKPFTKKQRESQVMYKSNKGLVFPYFWSSKGVTAQSTTGAIHWCKKELDYSTDGIVIECNSVKFRESENLNPDYARAIKLSQKDQEHKVGIVKKIEWSITNRDLMKPVLVLKNSLDFDGVKVKNITAHNALYVRENNIGKGCKVKVIRSGDVIPYIIGVKSKCKPDLIEKCVNCGAKLEFSGTDLYCSKHCYSSKYGRVFKFFSTLGVDNFSDGLVVQLIDSGFTSLTKIFKATSEDFVSVLGPKRGKDLHKALHDAMRKGLPIDTYMFGSNAYQNVTLGMGTTRLKLIAETLGDKIFDFEKVKKSKAKLLSVNGLGEANVDLFIKGHEKFLSFYDKMKKFVPLKKSSSDGRLKGMSFCFTGFRDKISERYIKDNGGSVDSSVKKTTTVLFASSLSSVKAEKAKSLGIKVVSKDKVQSYLSKL